MIKLWKDLESNEFQDKTSINHLNFALLHLCNLSNIVKNEKDLVLVERGVTDPIYYWKMKNETSDEWIREVVDKEMMLCGDNEVKKILLVQNDRKFIEEVVLKEPHRRQIFSCVDEYLRDQDKYIEYTRKYNDIKEIITINNAEGYLNLLGVEIKKD